MAAQVLADDNLLQAILAKVDNTPDGWPPTAWLRCANVCRQWRRVMFQLPLAWGYDPAVLDARQLEQVKATKLRFKTLVEVDAWMVERPGGTPLVQELMPDPRFQQQQCSTLSSISVLLPSNLDAVSLNKLASGYPKLASMRFEPAAAEDPAASFDAEMLKDWRQLRKLELSQFSGADLSEVPHGLHTLRVNLMDLQVEDEDETNYLELPDGMLLQRLELNLDFIGGMVMRMSGRLITAVTEVHVLAAEGEMQDTTLVLVGFASTAAWYEELMASRLNTFWVPNAVYLDLCPAGTVGETFALKLSELEEAAQAAMARGRGYLALSDVTTPPAGISFRLTRVPPA